MGYRIERPPVLKTFDLPTHSKLLKLKVKDDVKLIFIDESSAVSERMWVTITKIDKKNGEKWEGLLNNEPISLKMKFKQNIKFHPLDIIDIINNK